MKSSASEPGLTESDSKAFRAYAQDSTINFSFPRESKMSPFVPPGPWLVSNSGGDRKNAKLLAGQAKNHEKNSNNLIETIRPFKLLSCFPLPG